MMHLSNEINLSNEVVLTTRKGCEFVVGLRHDEGKTSVYVGVPAVSVSEHPATKPYRSRRYTDEDTAHNVLLNHLGKRVIASEPFKWLGGDRWQGDFSKYFEEIRNKFGVVLHVSEHEPTPNAAVYVKKKDGKIIERVLFMFTLFMSIEDASEEVRDAVVSNIATALAVQSITKGGK